jgi:hypothetical protein
MPIDYLATFPIPQNLLPPTLRSLLRPTGLDAEEPVDVAAMFERETQNFGLECLHMLTAVVPEDEVDDLRVLAESAEGLVASSTPVLGPKGASNDFAPTASGYDYIVAAWGDGSRFSFSLAEKVWMALGLSPRCVGNDEQRLVYDDLSLPAFEVATGEISAEYHFSPSRGVGWRMQNRYLREYLWMRGAVGARGFYYQASFPDGPELRALMKGASHFVDEPDDGWYELDLREHQGRLLLQLWATVVSVSCEQSPKQVADGLVWPGIENPVTHAWANGQLHGPVVHLDDRFLERYEQNTHFDSMPGRRGSCNPSYGGQWAFTDCERVGRNLIQIPIRELYKPKPDEEIVHAHRHAVPLWRVDEADRGEEHIASKTSRLVGQLLDLADNLAALGAVVGERISAEELLKFSRREIEANWWQSYSQLCRLAQVAPLDMSQQAFLARCKALHEVWQSIPAKDLQRILRKAGIPAKDMERFGSAKLLQAVLNLIERLDAAGHGVAAFASAEMPADWNVRNPGLAPLFLNNDLRIADAHELDDTIRPLRAMGFDTANVGQGYGRALDFVFDAIIQAFEKLNRPLRRVLER